ncbi:flagellin [Paracoccus siganidrum]|uniref:Flagellin n=1 Tax=Paracoccus siganidrum TaxID=1276757 RepID=A0A419A7H0_9RHOB|nr:flagellin [Paracoccus siganidrum]RJL16385.1 flagellin [Paracoccus siganidrum]RMC34586.1 flagellin [Paracoccus siganidrum]
MSSILTNNSALVALQTLKSINSNLAKTQNEISTGKSIATAKDNAAIWAISKVMETDQSAFKTIQSNLNVADAVVETARRGAEDITKLLQEMKDLALGATSDTADYATIWDDIAHKRDQITSIINASQINGVNLLRTNVVGTETDFVVLASLDRTFGAHQTDKTNTITVASVDFEAGLQADLAALTQFTDRSEVTAFITSIEDAIDEATAGAATLGAAGKRITDQANFVSKLADSLTSGIGAMVDADMEAASARLQALQTQQQLGIQSLSIANQAPAAILSLFRN